MSTTPADPMTKAFRKKQRYARKYFKEKYPDESLKNEILAEVHEQIRICEELCRPVTEKIIEDWINNKNLIYIMQTARKIKFA